MTPTDDRAATQLLADYRHAGGYADTLFDMPSRSVNPDIITVLSEWLIDLENRWPGEETRGRDLARLCIARTLGTKESRKSVAIPALISQFDPSKPVSLDSRHAAGMALSDIPAGKEYFEQLATIAADRRLGEGRQSVLAWLARTRHPDAIAIALSQLDDETVQGNALEILAKHKAQGVRERVEPFLAAEKSWHRQLARRILKNDQS